MAQAIMGAQILEPPIAAPIQAQLTSRLLRLPGELRNLIYTFVFSSTCIHHGPKRAKQIPRITKNPLSLLLTCRQIYHETKDIWLPRIEFSFFYPIPMVTRLRAFPAEARTQIRHIRMCSSRRSYSDWITAFEDMLEANLSDVRPKTLTVVGMSSWRAFNLTLGQLIRDGTVWGEKELEDMGRFVGPATRKNYCFEVSWMPKRLLVSPEEKKKEILKVPKVMNATAWRDYEAMKVSLTVYSEGRRLAVFGSGREQMRGIKWLEEERSYEKLRKKGSWKRFWKGLSSRIWNRVKLH